MVEEDIIIVGLHEIHDHVLQDVEGGRTCEESLSPMVLRATELPLYKSPEFAACWNELMFL